MELAEIYKSVRTTRQEHLRSAYQPAHEEPVYLRLNLLYPPNFRPLPPHPPPSQRQSHNQIILRPGPVRLKSLPSNALEQNVQADQQVPLWHPATIPNEKID
jgi:hypothetical protein